MFKKYHLAGTPAIAFEGFQVSAENIIAYSACTVIALGESDDFDTIILFGAAGGGKSRLLSETAEALRGNHSVVLTDGKSFVFELVKAIGENSVQAFRNKYLTAEYVFIDDIDQIDNLDAEEELLNLLNTRKAMILTSSAASENIAFANTRLKDAIKNCNAFEIKPIRAS